MTTVRTLLILITLNLGCKEPFDEQNNLLNSISGQWQVETASLDNLLVNDWNQMLLSISLVEDSLFVMSSNQPNGENKIWPDTSQWYFVESNEITTGSFVRNDSIPILVFLSENKLHINLHPPRDWSYKEYCPNDESMLMCSEEGQWVFILRKQ